MGIREQTNVFWWLKSGLEVTSKVMFWSDPPFRVPLWGSGDTRMAVPERVDTIITIIISMITIISSSISIIIIIITITIIIIISTIIIIIISIVISVRSSSSPGSIAPGSVGAAAAKHGSAQVPNVSDYMSCTHV